MKDFYNVEIFKGIHGLGSYILENKITPSYYLIVASNFFIFINKNKKYIRKYTDKIVCHYLCDYVKR